MNKQIGRKENNQHVPHTEEINSAILPTEPAKRKINYLLVIIIVIFGSIMAFVVLVGIILTWLIYDPFGILRKQAVDEYNKEYIVIAESLEKYFDENGEYPSDTGKLGLSDEQISPSSPASYGYLYDPLKYSATRKSNGYGPYCSYKFSLTQSDDFFIGPSSVIMEANYNPNRDRCNDESVLEQLEEYVAIAGLVEREAKSDLAEIETALSSYYTINGSFPIQLSDLMLPHDTISNSNNDSSYVYTPLFSAMQYDILIKDQGLFDQYGVCKYTLLVNSSVTIQLIESKSDFCEFTR